MQVTSRVLTLSARFHVDNTMLSGETPLKVVASLASQRFTNKFSRMAHLPTLPDPSSRRSPHGQAGSSSSPDSKFSFTELTNILDQHGAGSSSEGLALDLLLHEVVSQACSTTHAAGAAIALLRNGEYVGRAAAGNHAPDLGSQLSANSGLSGACVQSREVQRCDDTETDARVDAAACRRLGVRSIIAIPLMKEGEVVGVLETLSPHARVFTDADVQSLRELAQRIIQTMLAPSEAEKIVASELFEGEYAPAVPRRDPWITVLAILIVAAALLLGWMLGHIGTARAVEGAKTTTPAMEEVHANEPTSPTISTPAAIKNPQPTATPRTPETAAGGLTVYENGKLVFRMKPAPPSVRPQGVQLPASAANALLLERIEPQYPDAPRLAHIQGSVVLEVGVSDKGVVQYVRTLSGDPQLSMAATQAVQQWRYKPYSPRGQAMDFQTQITVDFKLP